VLEALADEVGHLLEEGVVASPKDVDAALLLGAGFPFFMGGLTPYLRENGYTFELTRARPDAPPIGYASGCDAHWGLRARPL
jgi:3-hydroxyacyl-CoA dehydrogenase